MLSLRAAGGKDKKARVEVNELRKFIAGERLILRHELLDALEVPLAADTQNLGEHYRLREHSLCRDFFEAPRVLLCSLLARARDSMALQLPQPISPSHAPSPLPTTAASEGGSRNRLGSVLVSVAVAHARAPRKRLSSRDPPSRLAASTARLIPNVGRVAASQQTAGEHPWAAPARVDAIQARRDPLRPPIECPVCLVAASSPCRQRRGFTRFDSATFRRAPPPCSFGSGYRPRLSARCWATPTSASPSTSTPTSSPTCRGKRRRPWKPLCEGRNGPLGYPLG